MVVKRDGFSIFGFPKGVIAPKHSYKKKNCTHFSFSRGCVQFTNGGNESRDVELYAFNKEAKYLLVSPLFL